MLLVFVKDWFFAQRKAFKIGVSKYLMKTKEDAFTTALLTLKLRGRLSYRKVTSWPYFRVKLSCVCLKFTYKKKSKNKMVKKDTQYLLLVGFKKIKYKKKG